MSATVLDGGGHRIELRSTATVQFLAMSPRPRWALLALLAACGHLPSLSQRPAPHLWDTSLTGGLAVQDEPSRQSTADARDDRGGWKPSGCVESGRGVHGEPTRTGARSSLARHRRFI
jgi:hypothetical protein